MNKYNVHIIQFNNGITIQQSLESNNMKNILNSDEMLLKTIHRTAWGNFMSSCQHMKPLRPKKIRIQTVILKQKQIQG